MRTFLDSGAGGRGQRARQGKNLRYDLELTLEAAFRGKEEEISFHKIEACPQCQGTGAKTGTSPQTCATCQGQGQVLRSQGFFQISTTCPTCHGQGQVIRDPCRECRGDGKARVKRKITVKVPPGVESGSQLRLRGEGEPGEHGGPPGDLFVVIHVKEHGFFAREGNDLICQIPISFVQAALGDTLTLPLLDEELGHELEIPPGTQPGAVLRVTGKGMPQLGASHRRGELYVRVMVKIPETLTPHQREMLEAFAETEGLSVAAKR